MFRLYKPIHTAPVFKTIINNRKSVLNEVLWDFLVFYPEINHCRSQYSGFFIFGLFGRCRISRKILLLPSSFPSTFIRSASTGRIFMKFGTWDGRLGGIYKKMRQITRKFPYSNGPILRALCVKIYVRLCC